MTQSTVGGDGSDPAVTDGWIVGVDVGGTFTDAVAVSASGTVLVAKVSSTPEDPAGGLVDAVLELTAQGLDLGRVSSLFHATTVATNAAITGALAKVVLVTTEGYRDILGYRSGDRPKLYDLGQPQPRELVPRHDRLEASERLAWNGDVVRALEDIEIARVVEEIAMRDPEAIAVSLLFSYMNDQHERRLGEAIASRFPNLPVSISCEVAREFREYPRTATTVLNAGLRPMVGSYLLRAQESLRELGMTNPFLIMQSNGGSVPAARADRDSHRLLLSGPTAGVAGLIALGSRCGVDKLISMDMGGTSLDVCLVSDGVPPVTPLAWVDSHPILAPSVDVVTVGAGGGSIAIVDATGRLRVGPNSAGANPGPAAYGRGGTAATLTDAHVVIGTLGEGSPLAGRLTLSRDASLAVLGQVAEQLHMGVEETAKGVVAVAMAHVTRALRRVSVERGIDPAAYTVACFGGAGPLHAGLLLREMTLRAVVVPPNAGLFSASGLLEVDIRVDESQTVLRRLGPDAYPDLAAWYTSASERVLEQLEKDGIPRSRTRVVASADCRYLGQGFELSVPLGGLSEQELDSLADGFHKLHAQTYGHDAIDEEIEVVNVRLSGFGALPDLETIEMDTDYGTPDPATAVAHREVWLPGDSDRTRVLIYQRDDLRVHSRVVGPAIIEEMGSTTLLLSGQVSTVDKYGNLWIEEIR